MAAQLPEWHESSKDTRKRKLAARGVYAVFASPSDGKDEDEEGRKHEAYLRQPAEQERSGWD